MAAVLLPAAAGWLFGFAMAVTISRQRGAEMALPGWLSLAAWGVGITLLAIGVILCALLWIVQPWPSASDSSGRLRLALLSLVVTGFLCCLASAAVPS